MLKIDFFSIIEYLDAMMMKLGVLGGGRSLTDRPTGGGDARSNDDDDVDRNSISVES